jgi:glycosyltransferase involved in cell wall biosynthesis
MLTPKVSVIIPVYNTEPYLRRCLDSVCGQTLRDIEIICVNDASPDKSGEILREYAARDERIRLIEFEKNRGVSAARNAGIDAAQGEYLGFVDSDDYVDMDFYKVLYDKAKATNADVMKGELEIIKPDGEHYIDRCHDNIRQHRVYFTQFTSAIYRTSFVRRKNLHFQVGVVWGEDYLFAIKTAVLAERLIVADDTPRYHYDRRQDSANAYGSEHSDQKIHDCINNIKLLIDFLEHAGCPETEILLFILSARNQVVWECIKAKTEHGQTILREFISDLFCDKRCDKLFLFVEQNEIMQIEINKLHRKISQQQSYQRVVKKLRTYMRRSVKGV